MKYVSLKNQVFTKGDYTITPFRKQDLFLIKQWRNGQIDVLRQNKVLTDEDQADYYEKHILPGYASKHTGMILFSYLLGGRCIGYGGLTNISWKDRRAELSFLVETQRAKNESQYIEDFSVFIGLVKVVAFEDLGFNRIHTETFDIRPLHVSILEKCGFALEGRMREHVEINGRFADSLIHGYLRKQYANEG